MYSIDKHDSSLRSRSGQEEGLCLLSTLEGVSPTQEALHLIAEHVL